MTINEIKVANYVSKSDLPKSDYVINPYVGCPHACKYCYASFMKRFTKHHEAWGDFVDVKYCDKQINIKHLAGKSLFLSSVTDCYNPYESKYKITQMILNQIKNADCSVTISTKSDLILRDLEILKQFKDLKVSISLNTVDEDFKNDMDNASSVKNRINTLKELYSNGIYTILFMSPIFPFITDFKSIIDITRDFVCEYWFENLNLRGDYKAVILSYILKSYPDYIDHYKQIYLNRDNTYWDELSVDIEKYCTEKNIKYQNYFHHQKLVSEKKENAKLKSNL